MQQFAVFVVAVSMLLSASSAAVVSAVAKDANADPEQQPAVVQMSMLVPAERIARAPVSRLLGFNWVDCGTAGTWVKIHSASVQPNPIHLNAKITIAFAFTAAHSFGDTQPLATSVSIKKKVFDAWVKLPCVDKVGSCDYPNLCKVSPPPASCPAEFVKAGVPCKCPIPARNYTLPGYTFTVDASKIPKFLESGDYKLSLNAKAGANQVLCVNAEFSLD